MGDRSNVAIILDYKLMEQVWLYSHWDGPGLALKVREAINKRWRWDDESYLTRIIICHCIAENWSEEMDYGISCSIGDNNYPVLVVDIPRKRVWFVNKDEPLTGGRITKHNGGWTFEEFALMDADKLQELAS